jgi:hypothetical protein
MGGEEDDWPERAPANGTVALPLLPLLSSTIFSLFRRKTHLTRQKTHKTQPKKPISNATKIVFRFKSKT